jgi:hypothetical protein
MARNENKLSLIYDKRQNDFVTKFPRSCDGALIMHTLLSDILRYSWEKEYKQQKPAYNVFNLKEELESRGYDLTTLKFSIELKKLDSESK